MKGKALRNQGMLEKIADLVLLKLFVSVIERCHSTDAPLAHEQNSIFKHSKHAYMPTCESMTTVETMSYSGSSGQSPGGLYTMTNSWRPNSGINTNVALIARLEI